MAEASSDRAAAAHDGASYPKPSGWEYMTHEERYAALRSEPKPESATLQRALSHAKQAVLHDQSDENRAFLEARREKTLADAPQFALTLSGAPTLSLSKFAYSITATVTYTSDPTSTDSRTPTARPILFRPSYGPLSASAPNENLYSLYTHPTCTPESRIPHVRPNASIRPPREADGSFTKEMEVTSWDGWDEVSIGDSVTRKVTMGLDERSGWKQHLGQGKRYWLRCDDAGLFGVGKLGLDRYWRYGRKTDVELPMRIKIRDPEAVAIPLGSSNIVEIEVVE